MDSKRKTIRILAMFLLIAGLMGVGAPAGYCGSGRGEGGGVSVLSLPPAGSVEYGPRIVGTLTVMPNPWFTDADGILDFVDVSFLGHCVTRTYDDVILQFTQVLNGMPIEGINAAYLNGIAVNLDPLMISTLCGVDTSGKYLLIKNVYFLQQYSDPVNVNYFSFMPLKGIKAELLIRFIAPPAQ